MVVLKGSLRSRPVSNGVYEYGPSSVGVGMSSLTSLLNVKEMEVQKRLIYKKKRELLQQLSSCAFFHDKAIILTIENSKVIKTQLHTLIMLSTASRLHSTRYLTFEMLLQLCKGVIKSRNLQIRLYALRDAGYMTIENQDGTKKLKKTRPKFFIVHRSGMNIIRIFEDYISQLNREYEFNPYL